MGREGVVSRKLRVQQRNKNEGQRPKAKGKHEKRKKKKEDGKEKIKKKAVTVENRRNSECALAAAETHRAGGYWAIWAMGYS